MKIYSLPPAADLSAGRQVNAEVIASEGGRSLVLVNGMPANVAGSFPVGHQMSGRLAATAGGFNIIAADNSGGVSAEKLLANAGIHEGGNELTAAFRRYGIALTQENLTLAGELLKSLPGVALDRLNAGVIALLLAKKLPAAAFSLLRDYLGGNLKFETLFAGLDKAALASLRVAWGQGKMMEALQQLLKNGMSSIRPADFLSGEKAEEFVVSLQFQEIMTRPSDNSNEGRMYFQWPLFWHGQDLPDTLEGEAFIPDGNDPEQGFSLRLLVKPPSLGRIEVAMHQLKKNLWVHFGVETEVIEQMRALFPLLQERLAGQDWEQMRFTVGRVRLLNDFFSSAEDATAPDTGQKSGRIDLRV
ncbi:MAG: hypothetical protein CVV42_18400 [Candidatus Riflebacteria bacterium HGW-Riflebacteria-2]|jgi:hypothetical protein|nr:MAG: hypothetical protein CVV42_18400 [Candidatus Riflebacteria bacterium HGW-Riflebacteria-2]